MGNESVQRIKMPTQESIRILVVDDEDGPQEALRTALASKGFQVAVAKSGHEACQMFDGETGTFDLVLSDMKMPGMTGIDLLHRIREKSPETLVIFITGYASLDSAIEAIREGAYDYLTKPFQIEELYIVVKNAVDRIRLIKENKRLFMELKAVCEKGLADSRRGGDPQKWEEEATKNVELLQVLQNQLLKIYTRTGPTDPAKSYGFPRSVIYKQSFSKRDETPPS